MTPASSLGARNAAAGISSAKGWNTAGVREASSRGAVAPRRVAVETAEGQQLEKLKFLTPKVHCSERNRTQAETADVLSSVCPFSNSCKFSVNSPMKVGEHAMTSRNGPRAAGGLDRY